MLVDFLENTQIIIEFAKDQLFVFCLLFWCTFAIFFKKLNKQKKSMPTLQSFSLIKTGSSVK